MTRSSDNPSATGVTQLLPCPFCGGDELSHGWQAPGVDGSMNTGTVECHSCNAFLYAEGEAEAINAWNTRQASIAQQAEEVARLKEALKPFGEKASLPDGSDKHGFITMPASAFRAARAALNEQPAGEG